MSPMPELRPAGSALALALLLALPACQGSETSRCPGLANYDPDRAALDANTATARGERYLLGVYGLARTVPNQADLTLPVRMIEGTGDHPECPGLNDRAGAYARRFNAAMQDTLR